MEIFSFCPFFFLATATAQEIPESWKTEWENPSNEMRPLQIVHDRDMTAKGAPEYYRDECGLGGLVLNVGGPG